MGDLAWSEREAAGELAGSLGSVASLCAHLPAVAAQIRTAVVRDLGPDERDLVRQLHDEIARL